MSSLIPLRNIYSIIPRILTNDEEVEFGFDRIPLLLHTNISCNIYTLSNRATVFRLHQSWLLIQSRLTALLTSLIARR